jgi:hypothetical protein
LLNLTISNGSHRLHHLNAVANLASFAGIAIHSGNVTGSQQLQASDQTTGRACAGAEEIVDKASWEVVVADLCRDEAAQPLPLQGLGERLMEVTYPANNSTPGDIIGLGQHVDAMATWIPLAKGYDDRDNRTPVNLPSEKQARWWQYPTPTFFPAAAEAQTDTELFRYIGRAATRLSGVGGIMKGRMAKRASSLPACTGKILVDLVEYAKKTEVFKKFW